MLRDETAKRGADQPAWLVRLWSAGKVLFAMHLIQQGLDSLVLHHCIEGVHFFWGYILMLMGRVKRYTFTTAKNTSRAMYGIDEAMLLKLPLLILYAV